MRAVLVVLGVVLGLGACAGQLVPTERAPIRWVRAHRHGHYAKGGVALDGWTCGEQYHRAVTGVAEAEDLMASCSGYNTAYAALLTTFVASLAVTGTAPGTTEDGTRTAIVATSLGVGLTSFALSFVMGYHANKRLAEAVRVYDAAP
jgi:hypothetical protein